MFKRTLAASAMLLFSAGVSSAAIVSYDLQGGQSTNYYSLPESFPLTVDGLTATFTARSFVDLDVVGNTIQNSSLATSPPHIGRYPLGAGVVNGPYDDSHTVDGSGWKDFIEIEFSDVVALSQVEFGYYSTSDHFRWMWDSNDDGEIGDGDFISDAFSVIGNNPFSGFAGVQSNLFAIGAFDDYDICTKTKTERYWNGWRWKTREVTVEYKCNKDDSWKLKIVKADQPEVIPLPAAGWLLLGAFGGLAALRRRG